MDTFPPAVPVGLMAVAGVNSIELAWQRNTEDDFAGYQVYRSTDGRRDGENRGAGGCAEFQ